MLVVYRPGTFSDYAVTAGVDFAVIAVDDFILFIAHSLAYPPHLLTHPLTRS